MADAARAIDDPKSEAPARSAVSPKPWTVKGVPADIREQAKRAAHSRGQTLGSWLNGLIEHAATGAPLPQDAADDTETPCAPDPTAIVADAVERIGARVDAAIGSAEVNTLRMRRMTEAMLEMAMRLENLEDAALMREARLSRLENTPQATLPSELSTGADAVATDTPLLDDDTPLLDDVRAPQRSDRHLRRIVGSEAATLAALAPHDFGPDESDDDDAATASEPAVSDAAESENEPTAPDAPEALSPEPSALIVADFATAPAESADAAHSHEAAGEETPGEETPDEETPDEETADEETADEETADEAAPGPMSETAADDETGAPIEAEPVEETATIDWVSEIGAADLDSAADDAPPVEHAAPSGSAMAIGSLPAIRAATDQATPFRDGDATRAEPALLAALAQLPRPAPQIDWLPPLPKGDEDHKPLDVEELRRRLREGERRAGAPRALPTIDLIPVRRAAPAPSQSAPTPPQADNAPTPQTRRAKDETPKSTPAASASDVETPRSTIEPPQALSDAPQANEAPKEAGEETRSETAPSDGAASTAPRRLADEIERQVDDALRASAPERTPIWMTARVSRTAEQHSGASAAISPESAAPGASSESAPPCAASTPEDPRPTARRRRLRIFETDDAQTPYEDAARSAGPNSDSLSPSGRRAANDGRTEPDNPFCCDLREGPRTPRRTGAAGATMDLNEALQDDDKEGGALSGRMLAYLLLGGGVVILIGYIFGLTR